MITLHMFSSKTCHPCKTMGPSMDWAETLEDVTVSKTYIEDYPGLTQEHHIRAVPTFIIFKNGMEIIRKMGAVPHSMFQEWLSEYREVQPDVFSEPSGDSKESGTPLLRDTSPQEDPAT